jgi:23S rRNA pseudouridine1911/1915/1917 synthase
MLRVLFEDNHCLAVVKPARLLVAGDETGDETLLDRAKAYLKQKYAKPGDVYLGLVHRLDRPVSGVVLFARTSKAAGRLSEQFRAGTTQKVYHALVETMPLPREGELHDWLLKDEAANHSRTVPRSTPGAKECALRYRVLEPRRPEGMSLIEVTLLTGRSHQIRVQLSSRGWPIVGDAKYGARRAFEEGAIALHAHELTFEHPVRREPVVVRCAAPWAEDGERGAGGQGGRG